ncbi:MAG: hypothetical protein IJ829_03830 [Kiritimatiellae bacterium]|nr:hypothetical protein [Kiritimatiellia bacterium]
MIYALRKLIAFVFLGGMFWFIYQDLGNLDKPWFMHALGMIAVAFAFFWLLIPMVVVWTRRVCRVRRNRERHAKWLAEGGAAAIVPHLRRRRGKAANLTAIGKDERIYFHEKGTLYTAFKAPPYDGYQPSRPGCPSDVAFPHFRQKCCVGQRTHCYITDRGVAFAGKDLDFSIPFAKIRSLFVEPGGIVFDYDRRPFPSRFAFTFQNPLIAADILAFAGKKGAA